jgi:hypothetical protein
LLSQSFIGCPPPLIVRLAALIAQAAGLSHFLIDFRSFFALLKKAEQISILTSTFYSLSQECSFIPFRAYISLHHTLAFNSIFENQKIRQTFVLSA